MFLFASQVTLRKKAFATMHTGGFGFIITEKDRDNHWAQY